MSRLLIYIFLLGLCPLHTGAQELLFSSLGNQIQLPSQECYKILQDREGYIWFSTDNGLCRYGNNRLTVFDGRNGLPEESVYNLEEDSDGKLWFSTSDNRILYYDKGHLKEAAFNAAYRNRPKDMRLHPIPYFMDMSDPEHSIVANSGYAAVINRKKNEVRFLPEEDRDMVTVYEKKNGSRFAPIAYYFLRKKVAIQVRNEKQSRKIYLSDLGRQFNHWITYTAIAGNVDFIGFHNELVKMNPDLSYTTQSFPGRILSLYVDKSNGLWVGVQNNGVYYFPDVNTMKLGHHSLTNYSVTGTCEDNEHGVWCSTLEKGIFYSKNKYLVGYTSVKGLDRTLTLLKYFNGNVYGSSSGKDLFLMKHTAVKRFPFPFGKEIFFSDIIHKDNYWILCSKEIMIRMDNRFKLIEHLAQEPVSYAGSYELAINKENHLFGIMYHCLYEITEKKEVSVLYIEFPFIGKTMLSGDDGTLLFGGKQGAYKYNIRTRKFWRIKGIPDNVTKLLKTSSGRIWVTTKNDGIYWIDGSKVLKANQYLSLKSAVCFDVAEDRNGVVWVGSNRGIYRFEGKGTRYKTTLYNISSGLSSSEVYKVAAGDEHIWFSTFEGLFRLPLDNSIEKIPGPAIHLQKLAVKNRVSAHLQHTLQLPYNQNDFRFTFDILTFKNGQATKLEYHLDNEDTHTVTNVSGNEVFLENLAPGAYKLTVYGINNNGVKSPDPEIFQIYITAPFWQTWWFISLAALVVLFLIFIIVRIIVRSIRKNEEAKTLVNKLMAEYQITALQAQMNPHFIFNAINTIQGYILEKNEDEAYSYLAKFSKLIRMVLHHSQEKVLLLEEELEVLNLYIELEQLRFDNCFDYGLHIGENVEVNDLYIPGMLLQPYIENAIWHGIVNLRNSRRGKLEVAMDRTGDLLRITITDNGVGREMAQSFRENRHHKSVGMQITGQRLDVMNQLHGYKMASVLITDLFDDSGNPAGTKVEISIPVNT